MLIGKSKGLPGEFLLLFTILIWLLFLLIYLGNRQNKLNRWCFLSGMCFSMGVFKEYLYFTLFPYLCLNQPWLMNESLSLTIYSLLTAVMYYYAMPSTIVFAFYFSRFDERHPRLFFWMRICVFMPAVLFGLRYPYAQTRHYQLYDHIYYLTAAVYNWIYGVIITILIVRTLKRECNSNVYRQKRLVAILTLIPIWYELLSAFLVHALRLTFLFKIWQGNLLIIFVLIIYYLYHAFNGGIMGARFMHESYEWNQEGRLINKGSHFIRHTVKNEMAKIEWCANSILGSSSLDKQEISDFMQIILRSTRNLNDYMSKINDYSEDIVLEREQVDIEKLLKDCLHGVAPLNPGIAFNLLVTPGDTLYCDPRHVQEVIGNLLDNALEAMGETGAVSICLKRTGKNKYVKLSISDTGAGIPADQMSKLFEPYNTTKTTNHHMGLGLYYCRNVMCKHGGMILIESGEGGGTTVTLSFPVKNSPHTKRR